MDRFGFTDEVRGPFAVDEDFLEIEGEDADGEGVGGAGEPDAFAVPDVADLAVGGEDDAFGVWPHR